MKIVKILTGVALVVTSLSLNACNTAAGYGMNYHFASSCLDDFKQICYAECGHVHGGKYGSVQACADKCYEMNKPSCN